MQAKGVCAERQPLPLRCPQQLQAPGPHVRICPCCHASGHAQPHCLSCTEMRLSLPSSCVTGWHPCKVSCTGAVEWGPEKSTSVSTGSCRLSFSWKPWGARGMRLPSNISKEPFPPLMGIPLQSPSAFPNWPRLIPWVPPAPCWPHRGCQEASSGFKVLPPQVAHGPCSKAPKWFSTY